MDNFQKSLEKMIAGKLSDNKAMELSNESIDTAEKASAVCAALEKVMEGKFDDDAAELVRTLAAFLQQVETEEAADVFHARAFGPLGRAFDKLRENVEENADDLLFLLKIAAMYGERPILAHIPELIRNPEMEDEYLWSILFDVLARIKDFTGSVEIAEQLRDPLPNQFSGIAYLDFVNELCKDGRLKSHPFDTAEGKKRLEGLLAKGDDDEDDDDSYAVSAASALAFISNPERDELLEKARSHSELGVRMAAAFADARLGNEKGIEQLVGWALQPAVSSSACEYLESLGLKDRVPEAVNDPDFDAMAEMCRWLSHPAEAGRPPDAIEVFDSREIMWEGERTPVWAMRFTYNGDDGEETTDYGMVGLHTFSFFDYGKNPTPEDIYALHLAFEVDGEPDLKSGRKLFQKAIEGI
ncbi:MAG: hypothetical protein ABFD69_01515 [Candidatus Sumerlaeia bacterium]